MRSIPGPEAAVCAVIDLGRHSAMSKMFEGKVAEIMHI